MIDKFFNLPLPKQLFFLFLLILVIVFIKPILLVAALALLVWSVHGLVFDGKKKSDETLDDPTLF